MELRKEGLVDPGKLIDLKTALQHECERAGEFILVCPGYGLSILKIGVKIDILLSNGDNEDGPYLVKFLTACGRMTMTVDSFEHLCVFLKITNTTTYERIERN